MPESLKEIIKDNEAKENKEPSVETTISNIKDDLRELNNLKLNEELNDARHSKNNTFLLNKRYSEITHFLFSRYIFYIMIIFVFILFILSDRDTALFIGKRLALENELINFIVLLCNKILHVFIIMFVSLLTFPTVKGLRRFFKNIIDSKKI